MASSDTFQGWLGKSPDSVNGKMEWGEFQPKKWEEDDVDIQITHTGVCGSDLHTLRSGWGKTIYPCCVGHEIVGTAIRVGSNVRNVRVGDRVGVGAQARSCRQSSCPDCSAGNENYCVRANVDTYNSKYPNGEGFSYGGYANFNRTNSHFVVKIPDGLASEQAAPMLCAGVTVFLPLRHHGCGPGKRVGVIGIGGLGHFAVLFAKALGADEVIAFSRSESKREAAMSLGADEYFATADSNQEWAKANAHTLDIIICTASHHDMPLDAYLGMLASNGTFVQVGAPDEGKMPPFNVFSLINGSKTIAGSNIGSPSHITEMLNLAAEKQLKPIIETRPMKEANQVIVDMAAGKARYRYVLVN